MTSLLTANSCQLTAIFMNTLARRLVTAIVRFIAWLAMDVRVTGRSNIPTHGPFLIIGNHFSLIEPILVGLKLGLEPTFFASADLMAHPVTRLILKVFRPIQVHRREIDRGALRAARRVLEEGGMLVIFPEGGIDEVVRDMPVEEGLAVPFDQRTSRSSAQLIEARDGAAYLATWTEAPILPIGFLHTEKVVPNFRRGRRTRVEMNIGPLFGPFVVPAGLRGPERRAFLETVTQTMMEQIAALLPPANRGIYQLPREP